jgi:hypothetical protein
VASYLSILISWHFAHSSRERRRPRGSKNGTKLGALGDRFYRNDWSFSTSRCFRREFRRDIFAFAIQTSSILVSCFGCPAFAPFPTAGIIGSACVGILEARSIGCILIGSKVGFFLSNNSFLRNSFIRQSQGRR